MSYERRTRGRTGQHVGSRANKEQGKKVCGRASRAAFDSSASACARGPRGARLSGLVPLSEGDHADRVRTDDVHWAQVPIS
jgi:hypothetical protein